MSKSSLQPVVKETQQTDYLNFKIGYDFKLIDNIFFNHNKKENEYTCHLCDGQHGKNSLCQMDDFNTEGEII